MPGERRGEVRDLRAHLAEGQRVDQYGFEILAEDVVAHVHDLELVLSAQGNVFGYADIDMTRPLPEKVSEMTTPDGRPAFRVFRRKPAAVEKKA